MTALLSWAARGLGSAAVTERDGTSWMSLRTTGPNGHGCGLDDPIDAAGLSQVQPDAQARLGVLRATRTNLALCAD